jgi:hypothetical protein
MNKMTNRLIVGLLLASPLASMAGTELDQVNAVVEAKAAAIDQAHGVLLTTQERNNLKIKLVATQVATTLDTTANSSLDAEVDHAINTFEITDPTDQRQLLIDISAERGGDGIEPPK